MVCEPLPLFRSLWIDTVAPRARRQKIITNGRRQISGGRSLGDTLQALSGHAPTDPLTAPGTADLTAHVDFEAIATASPARFTRLTPQGVFLDRLGIVDRTQALAANLTGPALESHLAAHRRLTHPAEMGHLFKVMGLYPAQHLPPPGLEP